MSLLSRMGLRCITGIVFSAGALLLAGQQPSGSPAQSSPAPAPATTQQPPSGPATNPQTQTSATDAGTAKNSSTAQPATGTLLKVTTRMVLVDVVVTDHSDKPVLDLKPEDFEVKENGKPQKVLAFGLQKEVPIPGAAFKPRMLPAGVFTNIPDFHPEAGPPTVLLIDALNTSVQDQAYLRHELVKYLRGLEPRKNVAIYTLGNRLHLLQDFTTDPELLQQALKKLTTQSSMLNENLDAGPDDLIATEMGDASGLPPQMLQSLRDFESEQISIRTDLRVAGTLDALRRIARNVAGFPGRKNLVWLSGAFPLSVLPDTELTGNYLSSQRQYGQEVQETASMLTDAQVAVYPVDARGLVGSLMGDASSTGRDATGRVRSGRAFSNELSRRSFALSSSHGTMNQLAEQTGGRAFYNRNDIDHAIALSVSEGSTYYSLGFYPEQNSWDGKFHKLEVKARRSGLKLRYRRGYFAGDPTSADNKDEKASRRELFSMLAPGVPIATSLPFVARVTPPGKEEPAVVVDFSVEPQAISFEPRVGLENARLDFVSVAFDGKGKQIKDQFETLEAHLKPATYADVMQHGLRLRQKLNLAPGKYLLKLGVRDSRSHLMGTITANVDVPQG